MRYRSWAPLCCALLVAAFVADLTLRPGGVHLTRSIDDIAEMVAAFVAGAAGVWRAKQTTGRLRASWALVGAGCAAWGVGEAIWCYYELLAGVDTPFPSWADAGFLVFPVLALIGLLVRPSAAFAGQGRIRVTMDAALVAAALFVISWVTALGQVYHAGGDSMFANVVSLAYPVSDLVLLTVTVIVVAYARTGDRHGLLWIAAGLVALSIGDSGFAYLTTVGTYGEVNLIDAGWVAGFLIIAVAGIVDRSDGGVQKVSTAPLMALVMPYLPAAAAIVAVLRANVTETLDTVTAAAAAVLVIALVARQLLVVLDNRSLMTHITHQAFHDELTGLANRALFNDRLAHALDLHRRDMRSVTVLLIDIDDFKTVNDSLGHPAGDELLVRISERLLASMRTGDTVARLGGDEFAILLEDGGDALDVAAKILHALDVPMQLAGRALPVRASIGVATLDPSDPPTTGTEMLKRADVAMYAAKRAGKSGVAQYTPELDGGETERLDLEAALLDDLNDGKLEVAYQPISAPGGTVIAFEALARWSHDGRDIAPETFVAMAARLGRVTTLDDTVLRSALSAAAGWPAEVRLAVNASSESLGDPRFPQRVDATLVEFGFDPTRLTIEVLESSLIEEVDHALAAIAALRDIGVRVAVDDFGAGFSSLARLRALEPDVVKIDRSLIVAEHIGDRPSAMLVGITDLAHRMGALVVAEGVETPTQLAAVAAAGCDGVQGTFVGAPGTAQQARDLLTDRSASPTQ